MRDCNDIRRDRYAFLDDELGARVAQAVVEHLAGCPGCASIVARDRAFLGVIAEAGRETAPAELCERVGRVLESAMHAPVISVRGRKRRVWLVVAPLAAAAALAAILLFGPLDGGTGFAQGFASDYVYHARNRPSAIPFGVDDHRPHSPELPGTLRGTSHCVINGRHYAH